MPIVDIYSRDASPGTNVLERVGRHAARLMGICEDHAWVFWHQLMESGCFRPDWVAGANRVAPVVKIRCKSSYGPDLERALIVTTATVLSDALGVEYNEIYVVLDQVHPGQLLVRGELWTAQSEHTVQLRPLAFVKSERKALGDDHWGGVVSAIELDTSWLSRDSLNGIDAFSHLEIIFVMDRVEPDAVPTGARRPRNLAHLPEIGILAQRPKARPNRLGLSRCELLERKGATLRVRGLDAVDGTPVLDIKPYYTAFGPRGEVREPEWVHEVMKQYY